jgi:hypothetical protein
MEAGADVAVCQCSNIQRRMRGWAKPVLRGPADSSDQLEMTAGAGGTAYCAGLELIKLTALTIRTWVQTICWDCLCLEAAEHLRKSGQEGWGSGFLGWMVSAETHNSEQAQETTESRLRGALARLRERSAL